MTITLEIGDAALGLRSRASMECATMNPGRPEPGRTKAGNELSNNPGYDERYDEYWGFVVLTTQV